LRVFAQFATFYGVYVELKYIAEEWTQVFKMCICRIFNGVSSLCYIKSNSNDRAPL